MTRHAEGSTVTVIFTEPQAEALHSALSLILNDPDWAAMLGGRREFNTLANASVRLIVAREGGVS